MIKKFLIIIFLLSISHQLLSQSPDFMKSKAAAQWADSILSTWTFEEKLGQLFTLEANSSWPQKDIDSLAAIVEKYNIGGLIFFKGGPLRQANQTNYYQRISKKVPMLISIDGEWGLSMRLDSTMRFPRQMTLSAMNNDSLVYAFGNEVARQCKRLGIHINFAPAIDINNNPNNPVISTRSFGDDKEQVMRYGYMYAKALQDNKVLASAKHFPGHGDTDADSHYSLPIIRKTVSELDSLELYPFRALIDSGVGSVMIAHLYIPSLDSTENRASSLSKNVVTDLLKKKLHFNGLIFTDALIMKGVTKYFPSGVIEVEALKAGADILLMSENVPKSIELINEAIKNKTLDSVEISNRVKKILMLKYWCGLNNYQPVQLENLYRDLNTEEASALNFELYKQAVTLISNKDATVPVKNVDIGSVASLVINDSLNNTFQKILKRYSNVNCLSVSKETLDAKMDDIIAKLSNYKTVILSVHNTTTKPQQNFGITDAMDKIIWSLADKTNLVVVVFGNTYCLNKLPSISQSKASIISYEDTYLPQFITAQIIFGGMPVTGKLPVTANNEYKRGTSSASDSTQIRLEYVPTRSINLNDSLLNRVDSIVNDAINKRAMPGCQIWVAQNDKVFYNKTFGSKMYYPNEPVLEDDIYDIASVTKIAGTSLAVMKLYEAGKIDLRETVGHYLKEFRKSNKKDLRLDELMTHTAGLQSWIPFYKSTLVNGKPSKKIFSNKRKGDFQIQVADSLFMSKSYSSKIWKQVITSPLAQKGVYVYSDLGMLIMQRIVEKITGNKMDEYLAENFYNHLGLTHMTFNPLNKFSKNIIAPTEDDKEFRKQIVRGYVHDPAAAMMGGVAGNAGLFSDANCLGVLMQMLLNGGEYGGKRYLNTGTVNVFTQRYVSLSDRRGLIFDKPTTDGKKSPAAKSCSPLTFGHTGFTGTCAWADPANNLVFVFLSNRVHPSATSNKLAEMNVRTNIQQVFYDAMNKN
jgi:beta-glucosidase-like glycosyl hydrolase/CubicO group peptidase (beta-lactamase class C family)